MTKQPGFYAWLAVVLTTVGSVFLNVLISVNLAERAADGQRRSICQITITQSDIYRNTPPSTDTGRAAAQAWENARRDWACDEVR